MQNNRFSSYFQREFQSGTLITSVVAGLIVGAIAVSNTVTYAALVFSGPLANYLSAGVGLALFSGFVLSIVVALMSSAPNMIAFPQNAVAPVLALLAARIVANMPAASTGSEMFMTVVAALMFCVFLSGVVYALFGRFKLGGLIRFMPYPVFGGFLAGLGWLLIRGGINVMTGLSLELSAIGALFQVDVILRWLPGIVFGAVLLWVQRKFKHHLAMPAVLTAGFVIFFLVLQGTGNSIETIAADGWLLGPFPAGGLWQPVGISSLQGADWSVIFDQFGTLVTVTLTGLIGSLLNFSGIELATQRDVDLDRDLQAAGLGNLVSSLGGGLVGYHSASLSILPHKMGARSRMVGVVASGLFGVALLFGASVLSIFPRVIIGGLLMFMGLSFLVRWVYEAWFQLPRYDYAIMLLILLVIAAVGLLQGIAVGLIVTIVVFVVNYSRIEVVRNAFTGEIFSSNVDRPLYHQRYLHNVGQQLLILKLQGFVFFGTAIRLLNQVRERVDDPMLPRVKFVLLDFHLINGIDSSALSSFTKMRQIAEAKGFTLVFSALSKELRTQLEKGVFEGASKDAYQVFPDLDHAVEWCEEVMLTQEGVTMVLLPPLAERLMNAFSDMKTVHRFMEYLERKDVDKGQLLIREGDLPSGLFFIEKGRITVRLDLEAGRHVRLRTMGPGTIVGELGFYLRRPATATVVAEKRSTVYRLSIDALAKMEADDPMVANAFHKYLARAIGNRLVNTTAMLRAFLD